MNNTEKIEQLKDQVLPFRPFEAMKEAENLVIENPNDAESPISSSLVFTNY